jgi:hypothetical protein
MGILTGTDIKRQTHPIMLVEDAQMTKSLLWNSTAGGNRVWMQAIAVGHGTSSNATSLLPQEGSVEHRSIRVGSVESL